MSKLPEFINEDQVAKALTWPLIYEAVRSAMISVSDHKRTDLPISVQTPRGITVLPEGHGVLRTLPGFIGNYGMKCLESHSKYNTLGCKLVTEFPDNKNKTPAMPVVMGNIILFECKTGQMICIIEGTHITTMRTAAASLVATKYLYFDRLTQDEKAVSKTVAIIGCGTQGRGHAEGMLSVFRIQEIKLWNRTKSTGEKLQQHLEEFRSGTKNPEVKIQLCESVEICCYNADIIVTATSADEPLVYSSMLKPKCHINAIGIGKKFHTELSPELYSKAFVYVDSAVHAREELAKLKTKIPGQVGDVITKKIVTPPSPVTIYQGLGMAAEDVIVGQYVHEKLKMK